MGSSVWVEFTNYDPDPLIALKRLHDEVFQQGRYFDRVAARTQSNHYQNQSYPAPATMKALIERVGGGYTHSPLDIIRMSQRWDLAAARPITPSRLKRYFRTLQPTHQILLDRAERIANDIPSDSAYYCTIFDHEQPSEICFIGCTGGGWGGMFEWLDTE